MCEGNILSQRLAGTGVIEATAGAEIELRLSQGARPL